jgi:hypothetical protein
MSYLLMEKLQYGESQAQESDRHASTSSRSAEDDIHIYLHVAAERRVQAAALHAASRMCKGTRLGSDRIMAPEHD